jgi:hypothetical protein
LNHFYKGGIMSDVQMLKKLGAKQILGNVKATVADKCAKDGAVYEAYSIYGTTNGIKTGTSTYGEWLAFVGNMEAINHVTGEMFAAIQCFIPEPLQSLIREALKDLDDDKSIEFAFTVSVKRRDDLKEGYEYLVKPHKQASESDPLEKLRNLIPAPNKNLPAPKHVEPAPNGKAPKKK